MKMKPLRLAAAVLVAIPFLLCSCGKKEESKSVETDEPQSREGKILKAAKDAAENANAKSFKLDEPYGIDGK